MARLGLTHEHSARRDRPRRRPRSGLCRGPQLQPARDARPAARAPLLRGRGPGAVHRRLSLVGGHQGPPAPRADPRGDRQQPRPQDGHRARGGDPGPVRHRPLVPVPRGRDRRRVHGAAGFPALGALAGHGDRQDVPELQRGHPHLLGDRPLRPHPAGEGGGLRRLPLHRGGAAGGGHHPGGRRGLHLPLPEGAGSPAGRRPAHGADERGVSPVLPEPPRRAASRTGSRSIAPSATVPVRPW